MTLTLAVLASILILLPGFSFLAFWNVKSANSGAGRPELPLASGTTLLLVVGISLIAHLMGYALFEFGQYLLVDLTRFATAAVGLPNAFHQYLPNGIHYTFVINPMEAMVRYADSGHLQFSEIFLFSVLVVIESLLVARFVSGDGFDLLFETIDINGQGWVYQHYVRPSRYGYRPIAYVLTNYTQNGLGLGYIGTIADIRHSEKGELLSISLLDPDRILFELKPGQAPRWSRDPGGDARFRSYGREPLGGIVALDAKSVANLLVRTLDKTIAASLAREVEALEKKGSAGTEVEATADRSTSPEPSGAGRAMP